MTAIQDTIKRIKHRVFRSDVEKGRDEPPTDRSRRRERNEEIAIVLDCLKNNPTVYQSAADHLAVEIVSNTRYPNAGGRTKLGSQHSTPERWHGRGTLPRGIPVGKLGANWYILDDDLEIISRGWHTILPTHGGFACKKGGHWYDVRKSDMTKKIQWVSKGALDRLPSVEELIMETDDDDE